MLQVTSLCALFLNSIDKVRILIGIDVDKYIANAHNKGQMFFGAEEEVKQDYLSQLRSDIESSPYSSSVEEGIFQLIEDLISGKLELRAHPSKKIHAKMYLLYPEEYNQYTLGAAITAPATSVVTAWESAKISNMSSTYD